MSLIYVRSGALTAKPSRYTLRGWEIREHPAIAAHDCVGANIFIHSRGQEYAPQREVMRVVPRENADINETWISDRDRFSYLGLQHPDRVLQAASKTQRPMAGNRMAAGVVGNGRPHQSDLSNNKAPIKSPRWFRPIPPWKNVISCKNGCGRWAAIISIIVFASKILAISI